MQEVYVNGSEFDSAQEILEYLRDEIGLDAENINTLYDALTAVSEVDLPCKKILQHASAGYFHTADPDTLPDSCRSAEGSCRSTVCR